ncbi:MAG: hypothetical protein H7287_06540 [Thermoleophilia bacterium]|nr:hypothetical protein [Thermoleophilia bacterium]
MQISRSPVIFRQPPNPEQARMQLESVQFDLSRLDRQLRSDASTGALISAQFPRDVSMLASSLRIAGSALRPLGSREAILGTVLIEAATDVLNFSSELQEAQWAGKRIDADAAWIHRFETPTQIVKAALDVLDSSSTWG